MTYAVQRAYDDTLAKSAALKTESARKNRLSKFFDVLSSHASDFPPETNEFIQNLINKKVSI